MALYDDDGGFYTSGGSAGRRADFLTSPEVGPLFGAVIAKALDAWWNELGCPDPFVVVEAAAGAGTLAAAVLAARPACVSALRYVLVERSAILREQAGSRLPLEQPAFVLGPSVAAEPGEETESVPGGGPLLAVLADLPAEPFTGIILANELLDNLPFSLLERSPDGWCEVRVGVSDGALVEVIVPAEPELTAVGDDLAPNAAEGARMPVQAEARTWVADALSKLQRGRLVLFDYADTTAGMAARPWSSWLRTYRSHGRGSGPLEHPGLQDVTCEVATDQLPAPTVEVSQAAFLGQHGLGRLVEEARQTWDERAAIGDLAALRAKSRVHEAAALSDPSGLGAFHVLTWTVD
jgi:SAM-dependent MidA family methyltransferase